MSSVFQAIEQRRAESPTLAQPLVSVLSGLVVGLGACSIFLMLLVPAPGPVILATVIAASAGGGACFARLVGTALGEPAGWRRTLVVALTLPLAGLAALLAAGQLEQFVGHPDPSPLLVFRIAFTSASAFIAFVCTRVAAWTFRTGDGWSAAFLVAGLTALTYLLVAIVIDPVPGFHVGGGDRAMPKMAALCNFAAGLVGGSAAHYSLTRAWATPAPPTYCRPGR
jgi:hypothetical protein